MRLLLTHAHSLTELHASIEGMYLKDLQKLPPHPQLTHVEIEPKDVEPRPELITSMLSHFPRLRSLTLWCGYLPYESIECLTRVPLTDLNLSITLCDKSLAPILANFHSLTRLLLREVDDDEIRALQAVKTLVSFGTLSHRALHAWTALSTAYSPPPHMQLFFCDCIGRSVLIVGATLREPRHLSSIVHLNSLTYLHLQGCGSDVPRILPRWKR